MVWCFSCSKKQFAPQINKQEYSQIKNKKLQSKTDIKNFTNLQTQKINLKYQFPASLENAKVHKIAVKFGYKTQRLQKNKTGQKSDQKQIKLCPCCNQSTSTKNIPFCYHTTDPTQQKVKGAFFYNSSSSLFFSFIKMSMLYLLLVFIICDAYNIIISAFGGYCLKNSQTLDCQMNFFTLLSAFNRYGDHRLQSWGYKLDFLCLFVVLGSIPFFIVYRKSQYQLQQMINSQFQTQDDYSLFIQNIPILDFDKQNLQPQKPEQIQFKYIQKLKGIFEAKIKQMLDSMKQNKNQSYGGVIQNDFMKVIDSLKDIQQQQNDINKVQKLTKKEQIDKKIYELKEKTPIITSMSLCWDLTQLQKIQKQRQSLMDLEIQTYKEKMKEQNYLSQIHDKKQESILKQIKALNFIQAKLCQDYSTNLSPQFSITHFVGKAFVSFQYEHYRQYILQIYQQDPSQFKYGDNQLVLSRGTYPTDIYWKNMKITASQRKGKVIISYLILAMILVFDAFFLLLIDRLKRNNVTEQSNRSQLHIAILNYLLTALGSILTVALNKGLAYVTLRLNDSEKHETRTNQFTSLIIKLVISQFLNSAFIFYLIQVLAPRPYLSSAGLVVQVSLLIGVSGLTQIALNMANISLLWKQAMLWWKYGFSVFSEKSNEIPTFQDRLNKDYQLPVFDMAGRYSYYLVHVYTCLYYSYLVPLGVIATVVIFGLQYWIDKFKMIRYSSEYYEMNYFLSRTILKMFEASLLIFAVGNLLFSIVVHHKQKGDSYIINIISVSLALIYIIFIYIAPTELQKKIFGKYQTFQKESYKECVQKNKFYANYWTQNPATVFAQQKGAVTNQQLLNQRALNQYFSTADISKIIQYNINDIEIQPLTQNVNSAIKNSNVKDSKITSKKNIYY